MQSNKCITGVSEGRKRENGAEKYFKKQCLKLPNLVKNMNLQIFMHSIYKENHSYAHCTPAAENQG